MFMRIIATVAAAWLLAACSGNLHPVARHSAAIPTLSYSQGAKICSDLQTWITQAQNQDQPRFNTTLEADETLAVNDRSTLGNDLSTEDSDLQQDNSLALGTDVISNQQGVSNTNALSSDCTGYGVTLNWGP